MSKVDGEKVTIVNRYDFLNLKDNVTFRWTLTNDRDTIMNGVFSPDCAPHDSIQYALTLPYQKGLVLLQFDIEDAQGYTFLHQNFVLNKPTELFDTSLFTSNSPLPFQEGPLLRVGRKPTMAELLKVKDKRIEKYLQPLENPYVKADVQTTTEGTATKVCYILTPDTTDTFLSELGVAYLLNKNIDRVQWIGQGDFPSYPGRRQANQYGYWAKHKDDLYFEGNRMGVDAAYFSDAEGNGLLITGNNMNINYEQTDRGIVMTVNAAVSGQGPKFARTAFPVISKNVGTVSGEFRMYSINASDLPTTVRRLFIPAKEVPAPFRPFITQYDTYLMKYNDIKHNEY